jgi:flagellar biosynthesis/type III secretory pathway chaperone
MSPRQQIAAILKQWLEKTHAEGHAIQTGDLNTLRLIQKSKVELREPLSQAVTRWRRENPQEANTHPFRAEVSQLLALETRYAELLAARKRNALEKKALLEQALFNLRRVRSSYTRNPDLLFNRYS